MRNTLLRSGGWALIVATVLALYRGEWLEAPVLLLLGLYFLVLGYHVPAVFGVRLPWTSDDQGA